MELKYIEAFLMVVEKGSFSKAAEALFITQPTISVRIKHLENELNTVLFERGNGKNIALTPLGKKVYPLFKEAYELIQKGYRVIEETNLKRKMIISCPNHMGAEILPELLKVLYDSFPKIEFRVKISVTDEIISDIRNGKVEIGLAYIQKKNNFKDLTITRVANGKNILVSSPDHLLTKKEKISVDDLKNERLILYNRIFPTTRKIEQYFKERGLDLDHSIEINNLGWIKMMVRKGVGISILEKMIVNEELKNGTLVELPLETPLPPTPVYLIFHSNVPNNIKQTVTETAKKLFQNY